MIKEVLIQLPVVNQRKDAGDKKWASRSCAICSLKMMLDFFHNKKSRGDHVALLKHEKNTTSQTGPVTALIKKGLERDGYIENIGWKHRALVDVADEYGFNLTFFKRFPKTRREKLRKLNVIQRQVIKGNPVIVSVFYKFNSKNGGHMVLIRGVRKRGGKTIGYHIQDPDSNFRGHNYYVSKNVFLKNWRGGLIYSRNAI